MPALVPPQMIEIEAVGAIASLWREALHHAALGGVRAGAALLGQHARGRVGLAAQVLEQAHVPRLGQRAFERHVLRLQEGVEAHQAQAHRALAHGGVDGALHAGRRAVDEVLQHVVEEAHDVLDEASGGRAIPGRSRR